MTTLESEGRTTKLSEAWPDYLSWISRPTALRGIASIMDLSGVTRIDMRRFSAGADVVMLNRDGQLLAVEYKRAYDRALAALRRELNPQQEQLFKPDEG